MTALTRALGITQTLPMPAVVRAAGLLALVVQARALSRQRAQLADLPAERLADLGLSVEQARAEAARPFWDAPRHWRG